VPGVFDEMYKPFRFRIQKSPRCLICAVHQPVPTEDLDAALDKALTRLQ
jgi:hypothetical protein